MFIRSHCRSCGVLVGYNWWVSMITVCLGVPILAFWGLYLLNITNEPFAYTGLFLGGLLLGVSVSAMLLPLQEKEKS